MKGITIIKIGGAALGSRLDALWKHIVSGRSHGPVVLVHGGGPQSTALARRLGHEPRMIQGRRVTEDIDLDIAKMTLGGTINADLVASALVAGLPAVGLSGISGRMIRVVRRPPWTIEGQVIDFGHVGDVVGVDTRVLEALLHADLFPVVAGMGIDTDGAVYNVNADTVATEIAAAFPARRLVLVTDAGGIRNHSDSIVSRLTASEALSGISDGWIKEGMMVKVQTAVDVLRRGVGEVRITGPEGLGDPLAGTTIVEDAHA